MISKEGKVILSSREMIGRNNYCDDLRVYALEPYLDGNYYSNMSSFICASFISAGYDIPWMNSYAIKESDLFDRRYTLYENDKIRNTESVHVADLIIWVSHIAMVNHIDKDGTIYLQHQDEGKTPSIITLDEAYELYYGLPVIKRFKEFI